MADATGHEPQPVEPATKLDIPATIEEIKSLLISLSTYKLSKVATENASGYWVGESLIRIDLKVRR